MAVSSSWTNSSSAPMIQVAGVSKVFGDVVAVSNVTFSVSAGVTALLGPNGAGKSTLFRMICGLARPTKGSVSILGANARYDKVVRGRVGLVPQQDALFDGFTALEFVRMMAATEAVTDPHSAAYRALETVDLDHEDTRPVSQYSKGMRQRVKLAAALVHDPEILVLDEPLAGLDPLQRRRMIKLFHGLGDDGRCVLVSSHVLQEVARLGSRILVIVQGRLAASGDYQKLRELMDDRPYRIRVGVSDPRMFAAALMKKEEVMGVNVRDGSVVIETMGADGVGREIAPLAQKLDVRLTEVKPLDDDLESVFRYLLER